MNTATSGLTPSPQAVKNTEMSGNISDVSQQKVNVVNSQVTSGTTAQNDYSVYLRTTAAKAAAHGIFLVIPDPNPKDAIHTTKKMPETQGNPPQGEGAVKSYAMTSAEAMKTTSSTRFLGRRFGAGDGIIAIDCDGWHPPADWTRGTGYREVSASGTGDHIIAAELGINVSTVSRHVRKWAEENAELRGALSTTREVELSRLDDMLEQVEKREFMDPEKRYSTLLHILDRKYRLMGLYASGP